MPATAVSPVQLALPLLIPHPPATVDGIPGQMDIVAAVTDALEAPAAARRMAAELSATTGLRLRALPNGAITSAP